MVLEFIETQQPHVVVHLQLQYIVDQLKQDQQQLMVILLFWEWSTLYRNFIPQPL